MTDMQTRKAYVGMSGPLFFDFRNAAPRTEEDTASSPNPILDSPAALMLLYDEIWFLSRSLCPTSMRTLPFVRFILEDSEALKMLNDFSFDDDAHDDLVSDLNSYLNDRRFFDDYDSNVLAVGASWWGTHGAAIDNHSHGLDLTKIGISRQYQANAINSRGVIFDQAVLNHLGGEFELVTNSFLQEVISPTMCSATEIGPSLSADVSIVDALTLSDLPTRLLKNGPDVNFLGELREDACLPAFRQWARQRSLRVAPNELREIEQDVTEAINKHMKNYFKKFDPKQFALSNYKTILVEGIGLAIPGFSKAMKAAKTYREWQEVRSGRWSAFLFNAKHLASTRPLPADHKIAPRSIS